MPLISEKLPKTLENDIYIFPHLTFALRLCFFRDTANAKKMYITMLAIHTVKYPRDQ
jgi:hypothetical protein